MNKQWKISALLMGLSGIIIFMLFFYDAKKLPGEYIDIGNEKEIDEKEVNDEEIMLTYGPYHQIKNSPCVVVLHYKTDVDDNLYKIYSDTSGTIQEDALSKDKHYIGTSIRENNISLQVLTYFEGIGSLKINWIFICPIWLIFAWGTGLLLMVIDAMLREKKCDWFGDVSVLVSSIVFIGTISYADCSANMHYQKMFGILLLVGILVVLLQLFDRVDKDVALFALTVAFIGLIEWWNISYYGFKYMALYLTSVVSVGLLLCIYLLRNHPRIYSGLLIGITAIFSIYSMIQYIYYSYFKDFFTIKIIRLFSTAMEASASIKELLSFKAIGYLIALIIYIGLFIIILISKKKFWEKLPEGGINET